MWWGKIVHPLYSALTDIYFPLSLFPVTTREHGSPSVVRNISAALVSDKEVRVTWTMPFKPNGEIAKYDILSEPVDSMGRLANPIINSHNGRCSPCSLNVHLPVGTVSNFLIVCFFVFFCGWSWCIVVVGGRKCLIICFLVVGGWRISI